MINFLLFPIFVLVVTPDYIEHPNMKAMFMKEWQCKQVKSDKEKCIKLNNEFYGLYDENN